MGDRSRIEWTEASWNVIRGCSRRSAGCEHCYAERVAARFSGPGMPYEGLIHPSTKGWNGKIRFVPEMLDQPLRWKRPRRIFVGSMSDLFHESVPDAWIDRVYAIMAMAHWHTFQVLTKRHDRLLATYQRWAKDGGAAIAEAAFELKGVTGAQAQRLWPPAGWPSGGGALPNVWVGVSVENQAAADLRIPYLLQVPATVIWLSCEPLIGPINFRWQPYAHQAMGESYRDYLGRRGSVNEYEALRKLDWIVVGGESGPLARPMHPAWARSIRDQCDAAGVHYYFKQWGEYIDQASAEALGGVSSRPIIVDADDQATSVPCSMVRIGKKRTGRLLDGLLHDAYPVLPVAPSHSG